MKKILFFTLLICLFVTTNAQSWLPGSSALYTSPVSTKVGIGEKNPKADLHIMNNTAGSFTTMRLTGYDYWGSFYGKQYRNWELATKVIPGVNMLELRYGYGTSTPATIATFNEYGDLFARSLYSITSTSYYIKPGETGVSINVAGAIHSKEILVTDLNTKTLQSEVIKTSEIVVDCNNLADYVFDDNYTLLSLDDVSSYISENNHLPGMPSANEVKENGMNVSKMNNLLLQKVEELTLYIIQQQNEINQLKEQIK